MQETLNLVYPEANVGEEYSELIHYINEYIKNSSDLGPDFSVIKEIIDNQCDMVEERVSSNLFSPMYIGLVGTLIGVISGIIGMAFSAPSLTLANQNSGNDLITELLIGVGVAMFASLVGLSFSIINSFIYYRTAKYDFDKGKLRFINFIQVQLLPLNLRHDNSSTASLNNTIRNFNTNFNKKLNRLGDYLEKNMDAFKIQESLLERFDQINIKQFTTANIKLFDHFENSAKKLELLNESLQNVNSFVSESSNLSKEANLLFSRFTNFEKNAQTISDNISNKLEAADKLINFLNSHFQELQNLSQLSRDAVGKVDEIVGNSIDELLKAVQAKQGNFVTSIGNVDNDLNNALEQLNKSLKDSLSILVERTSSQAEFIGNAHDKAIEKFDAKLEELNNSIEKRIENLHQVSNEGSNRLEKIITENYLLFSKLTNLDLIKNGIDSLGNNIQHLIVVMQKNGKTVRKLPRKKNTGVNGGNKKTIIGRFSRFFNLFSNN